MIHAFVELVGVHSSAVEKSVKFNEFGCPFRLAGEYIPLDISLNADRILDSSMVLLAPIVTVAMQCTKFINHNNEFSQSEIIDRKSCGSVYKSIRLITFVYPFASLQSTANFSNQLILFQAFYPSLITYLRVKITSPSFSLSLAYSFSTHSLLTTRSKCSSGSKASGERSEVHETTESAPERTRMRTMASWIRWKRPKHSMWSLKRLDQKVNVKKDFLSELCQLTLCFPLINSNPGPKNRRLPKRQPVNEPNTCFNEQPNSPEVASNESPPQDRKLANGFQFKPNLNELSGHRLRSNTRTKSTDQLDDDDVFDQPALPARPAIPAKPQSARHEAAPPQLNQQFVHQFIVKESNVMSMKQNLNKLRANSTSILDDYQDDPEAAAAADQTVGDRQVNSTQIRVTNHDGHDKSVVGRSEPKTEAGNVPPIRSLIQQLRKVDQAKSMVNLSQTDSDAASPTRNKFFLLKSHNRSNDFLTSNHSNKLEINRSSSRLNAAKSNSKLDDYPSKLETGRLTSGGRVVSLSNLANNSSSNLIIDGDATGQASSFINPPPAYFRSTALPHQLQTREPNSLNVPASTKSNTLNSNVSSNYRTALSSVSRNNSSSSSKSSSSTHSGRTATGSNSSDNQSNEGNSKCGAAEASKLKKRIQNKKALNSKFYVQLDNEANLLKNSGNQFGNNQTNRSSTDQSAEGPTAILRSSNAATHHPSSIAQHKQPLRARASLNLNNNNVDELTKKFIEKGLSGSVGSLRMLSNEDSKDDDEREAKSENRRSLNERISLDKSDVILPTYV